MRCNGEKRNSSRHKYFRGRIKNKDFLISTRNSIGIDDLLNEIPNIFDSDTSTIVDNNYMDFETIQKINNENNSSIL